MARRCSRCAVGCLVLALRVKRGDDRAAVLAELEASDPEDDEAAQAMANPLGVPHLVGWKLVALKVLAWVRSHLQ
jgi:hypothetical protein